MNRDAIFCMLLYSRTEEKMTIKSTEMTRGVSAVHDVTRAAGSRLLSAVPALSVLPAAAKRGFHRASTAPLIPPLSPLGLSPDEEAQGPVVLWYHIASCDSIWL